MSRRTKKPPGYRHYKPRNLAVVRIGGRDYYLGPYGSAESHAAYLRLLAEHSLPAPTAVAEPAQSAPSLVATLTVDEMLNEYRKFASGYYSQGGRPGKEFIEMGYAAAALRKQFGALPAAEFGPSKLKAVQRQLVEEGKLCRRVINRRLNRIKRIVKWAVGEELVPPGTHQALLAVPPLQYGRTAAREKPPVKSIPWSVVEPVLAELSRPVRAMVELQWLTGARPCEIVAVRPCDIDRSEAVWIYSPAEHKNRWRGTERAIPLGPKAQEILRPFLLREPAAFCFSPEEAEAERNAQRRAERNSPMTPSQQARVPKAQPGRAKRPAYDRDSYRQAIEYGIAKANRKRNEGNKLPKWTPLQIRHGRATEVRKEYGLEGAQVLLGHARADVTEIYAEANLKAAIRIAAEQG